MMRFQRYTDLGSFSKDTWELLLENEAQNNLPVAIVSGQGDRDISGWLLATVKDDAGGVLLTAICTPPHNLILYETRNLPGGGAAELLSRELRGMGYEIPGVMGERRLVNSFAGAHAGAHGFTKGHSMIVMRLDRVGEIEKAPGGMRLMEEKDLFFAPYWDRAFAEECGVETYDIPACAERARRRCEKKLHFFWEDGGIPVSQAANGRNTPHGAVVNFVYTPPHFRGRGYASSLVAELSARLLEQGQKFCCLFADAANPISCGIYRKLGYRDVCVSDTLLFKGGDEL